MTAKLYRRAICNDPAPKGVSPDLRIYRPVPFEICYLSWGRRRYGDAPLVPVMSEGWHYFIVLRGSPWLVVGEKRLKLQAGAVNIAHPDCPLGHSDEPGRSCEMLTWIWRTPPTPSILTPEKGQCVRISLKPDQLRRLKELHRQCRHAVATSNEHGSLQLRVARLQLDLWLLEARIEPPGVDHHFRIELARQFLRNHLGDMRSINQLRDYLQISDASLKRLFHEHTGKSPGTFVREMRMVQARDHLLPHADSVKSVAYALGYRHPADFSRAFKRHFGLNADSLLRTGRSTAGNGRRPLAP